MCQRANKRERERKEERERENERGEFAGVRERMLTGLRNLAKPRHCDGGAPAEPVQKRNRTSRPNRMPRRGGASRPAARVRAFGVAQSRAPWGGALRLQALLCWPECESGGGTGLHPYRSNR